MQEYYKSLHQRIFMYIIRRIKNPITTTGYVSVHGLFRVERIDENERKIIFVVVKFEKIVFFNISI